MNTEFLDGNRLTLLNSGEDYFPALLEAIELANTEIYLESYIFAADTIGTAVVGALCRASARGVSVKVTVDGFGARNFADDFLARLTQWGVRVALYRPHIGVLPSLLRLRRRRFRRLHRKLAVIDAHTAFIGGINIIDDHNAPPEMRPRFDYAVRVEGPTAGQVHKAMRRMWETVTWARFKRRFRPAPLAPQAPAHAPGQRAALLIRDNIRHRNDIQHAYLEAIDSATREIIIANAYFLPGLRFRRALYAAARRGVRITVLLQGKTDHPLMRYATKALYAAALRAKIRIFEYQRSFLHAKVAVIDGRWATVGSSNIDPFSFLLAKEANLVVDDARFASELEASLRAAMAGGAREMLAEQVARQSLASRALSWVSYGLVRLLTGFAGYGHERHLPAEPSFSDSED